jgi:hypothetical protein
VAHINRRNDTPTGKARFAMAHLGNLARWMSRHPILARWLALAGILPHIALQIERVTS